MTCARCGFTTSTTWSRCPSCAAPAGSAPRVPVDCLAKPTPRLPDGVHGQPVGLLGSIVVGLLSALGLLTLVQATGELKAAQAIARGDADASSVGGLLSTTAALSFVIGLSGIVVFFVWLVRAVRNTEAFGVVTPRYRGGWVVGNWFIPVLALWRPKRTVDEVWRGSGGPSTSLIGWWWGLLVVAFYPLPIIVALAVGGGSRSRGDYQLLSFADLVVSVVWAGAAYLVYRITSMQEPVLRAQSEPGAAETPVSGALVTA